MGWKVVTIIGAHVRGGPRSQPTGWGQSKKTLSTVDGPLLCVVTKAYHLHVFLSLANLNIEKSLKYSNKRLENLNWVLERRVQCARREPRLTDRKTEPSTPSCPSAPERTNTNRSLNMQTEKDVKEPNSAPTRGIQCAQSACREPRLTDSKSYFDLIMFCLSVFL